MIPFFTFILSISKIKYTIKPISQINYLIKIVAGKRSVTRQFNESYDGDLNLMQSLQRIMNNTLTLGSTACNACVIWLVRIPLVFMILHRSLLKLLAWPWWVQELSTLENIYILTSTRRYASWLV